MRITKRRASGYPKRYDINADGKCIGGAHEANSGPVWWVRAEAIGIPLRNSAAEGLKYETVEAAANDAVAYAKRACRPSPGSKP